MNIWQDIQLTQRLSLIGWRLYWRRIEIGCKKEDNKIIFYVKDNGIGISKIIQYNLFQRFSQLDVGITRSHGGIGLSLTICKGIIEGMGGRIWIESEEGKGTSIYFTFPKNNQ